jgi:ribonuclease HI
MRDMMSDNNFNVIELYVDGSSQPNPGPSGIGYIIRYWALDNELPIQNSIEGSKGFRVSTNNRMELLAFIHGMNEIILRIENSTFKNINLIKILTDSKYLCDAINNSWLIKWQQNNWITSYDTSVKNRDLWEEIIKIINKLKELNLKLKLVYIPGHQGYEFNEQADQLAVNAARNHNEYLVDEVYESQMNNKRRE